MVIVGWGHETISQFARAYYCLISDIKVKRSSDGWLLAVTENRAETENRKADFERPLTQTTLKRKPVRSVVPQMFPHMNRKR